MIMFVFFIIGAVMAIGPWFVPDHIMDMVSKTGVCAAGVVVLGGVATTSIFMRLYRKASANMAFVKTGMGGADVILDGGRVIFPVLHQIIPVSLETMRLN